MAISFSQMRTICRYIHLNPVEAKLVKRPESWRFSDYTIWIGKQANQSYDESSIRVHFQNGDAYKRFVMDFMPEQEMKDRLRPYLLDE